MHRYQQREEAETPAMHFFNPYINNGGSVLAVAGQDFAIIGADTRLSCETSILTREQKKLFPLTKTTVLASTGCWCDTLALTSLITMKKNLYAYEHKRDITITSVAQMLSTVMYCKRTFPYYVFNVVAGLDATGSGCVFNYDVIGHYERVMYHAGGCSGVLLLPLLDNQIGGKNIKNGRTENSHLQQTTKLPKDEVLAIVKDLFITAAERDIFTGDGAYINIITQHGIEELFFDLRKD